MSQHSPVETIEAHGCSIVLRRVEGPEARELFFGCQPTANLKDAGDQADAIYHAILDTLEAEGGSMASVVTESIFLRDLKSNIQSVRDARDRALTARAPESTCRPASCEVEQPPLNQRAYIEVLLQAVIPHDASVQFESIAATPACSCAECARVQGLRISTANEARFYVGGVFGAGKNAYEQTLAMFEAAEKLLQQAGMSFSDVQRTWIYLREMERDYDQLNRARRSFFESRGIDPVPASTGIGAGLVPAAHDLSLGVYAVKSGRDGFSTVMKTPTLNEAPVYGADFSRGMRIVENNKIALHVSGTASLNEAGASVHEGDFELQVDRMLLNVAALLKGQGATYADIVSAITYLKNPADAARLREKLHGAGFEGFPNILVNAEVCRPELLCETEVLAVISGDRSFGGSDLNSE